MFFITCDYDEGSPETYRAIEFKGRGAEKKAERIATGDPLFDYLTAMYILSQRAQAAGISSEDLWISGSSSIDNFAMDGGVTLDCGEGDKETHKKAYRAAEEYEDARLTAEGKTKAPDYDLDLDPMPVMVRISQVAAGGAYTVCLFVNKRLAHQLGLFPHEERAREVAEQFASYLKGEGNSPVPV